MLTELHIRQFALIEQVHLDCQAGMTVISGETGAGKSIIVDALGAVFGARASADWVRHGAKQAELLAVLELQDKRLDVLLDEQGMDNDDALILRRTINADGRSRAWVNDTPVSVKFLQKIAAICLDFHGQHEHQALMQPAFQQQLIDSQLQPEAFTAVAQAFAAWRMAVDKLEQLQQQQVKGEEQIAWMRQQADVLHTLDIHPSLEDELSQYAASARHVLHIQQAASQALILLEEQEINARSLLAQAAQGIGELSEHHQSLADASDLLAQIEAMLSEVPALLHDAREITLDEEALQLAEERLANLRDAMRRHQCDEAGLLLLMQNWQEQLALLDTAAWDEAALQAEIDKTAVTYRHAAGVLSEQRQQAAASLIDALRPYMDQLGLAGMRLNIDIARQTETSAWQKNGWDNITFLLSSNIGEPFRSLAQVASGGELSRLILALKAQGAYRHAPAIAVFDEVDVGIGGETAWCVGQLLRQMGAERQVFVISHLPQVAACANHQFHIVKTQQDGRTATSLKALSDDEREQEIARMLGGHDAAKLATQMLQRGGSIDNAA